MKCIVFDADGMTLFGELFSEKFEKDQGLEKGAMTEFFSGVFQKCLIGQADLKEEVSPLLTDWKWNKGVDAFLEEWFNTDVRKEEEILEYITSLETFKILTTNNEAYRTTRITESLGDYFDVIISSSTVGHKKPHKNFFTHIENVAKENKITSFMFWDDDPKNVKGALEAGLDAHLYSDLEEFKEKVNLFLSTP